MLAGLEPAFSPNVLSPRLALGLSLVYMGTVQSRFPAVPAPQNQLSYSIKSN